MNLKQKFRSAIKRGTGETHNIIKENPLVDFSKDILKACLFNYAYDVQSEGGREVYLAELINLCAQKSEILSTIYKSLGDKTNDDWSIEQLFDLAAIFAREGDEKAKKAIWENYYKHAMDDADWAGRDAVIDVFSLDGLKYIAETTGKMLKKFSDKWEDSFLVDYFQKENPSIDVYDELRKEAEDNPHIKKYLDEIEQRKFSFYNPKEKKEEKYDYQYVKDRFKNKYLGIGPRVFEKLSKKDIKKLADEFLQETDSSRQEKYLRIFAHVKFPYDYQPILQLAKMKSSKKNRIVYLAVEALQFFRAKDIRQFAVEKLSSTDKPEIYTNLLIGNYKKDDWKLLKSIAEKYKNPDKIHEIGASLIDIYEANQTKECREPLEVIYNKMNCGLHRTDLVKILIENDVLSDKIRREIQFDCNEETRKLSNFSQ